MRRRDWGWMNFAVCTGLIAIASAPAVDGQDDESEAMLPTADSVRRAFETGAAWVRRFSAPGLDEPESRAPIESASGVCIVLRNAGRVVGVGADWTGDDLMLRRAIGRALGDVLGDDAASGEHLIAPRDDDAPPAGDDGDDSGVDNDTSQDVDDDAANAAREAEAARRAAMQELIRSGLGERLTIEMDVAGPLQPLLGRTFDQVSRRLEPGLDGVALRAGERHEYRFPAQMRANNTAGGVGQAVQALAFQMNLPRVAYDQLTRDHDVAAYRFRTRTLIELTPGGEPVARLRGDDVVPLESVTIESVRAAADGVVQHILKSSFPGPEPFGLMGSYVAVADEYRPFLAPPMEQALCAWALAKYADAPGIDATDAEHARAAAIRLLQELAERTDIEPDPLAGPVESASIVLAARNVSGALDHGAVRGMYEQALRIVLTSQDADGVFRVGDGTAGAARAVDTQTQAMMAFAMAEALRRGESTIEADRMRLAIDAAWDAGQVVSMTPWQGWAEIALAEATGSPLNRVEELGLLRQVLHERRLGAGERPVPADLAGGFDLDGSGLARAQSARPAGLLASMLHIEPLTSVDGREAAISAHVETLRFLVQLTVREGLAGSLRNPPRALGGVRAAPWDTDQPLAAQAMTLAAFAESLVALDRAGWTGH